MSSLPGKCLLLLATSCLPLSATAFTPVLGEAIELTNHSCEVTAQTKGFSIQTLPGDAGELLIKPQEGPWDLSTHTYLDVQLRNNGIGTSHVSLRLDNPDAKDWQNSVANAQILEAGESATLRVFLSRKPEILAELPYLKELAPMHAYPGGAVGSWRTIDPEQILSMRLRLSASDLAQDITVLALSGGGSLIPPQRLEKGDAYFPMIDTYGQYKWSQWHGKVQADRDLKDAISEEAEDLAAHPGPAQWNRFGGYTGAPKQEATGFFRTQKIDGKWWIIDPEGYLYWAHGATCVNTRGAVTATQKKQKLFEDLPQGAEHPLAAFYDRSKPRKPFNFTEANLYRKYGEGWKEAFYEVTIQRFRSWGLNNFGAWSDGYFYNEREAVPYTVILHPWPRQIGDKFPDVFDPAWEQSVAEAVQQYVAPHKEDPYLFGVFINNELHWGGGSPLSFMRTLQRMEADSPTKQAWVNFLKEEYESFEALREATGCPYQDWDALLAGKELAFDKIAEPAKAFYAQVAERYFSVAKQELKKVAPNTLYLGCRMHSYNHIVELAAAKHCDIVSVNRYEEDLSGLRPAEGVDKPYLISEFHFGTVRAGSFWPGLKYATDAEQQARKYRHYVESALNHPACVGTHWFQYTAQSTTGRNDGENGDIGLVSLADVPHEPLRSAVRQVGYSLYKTRLSSLNRLD